MTMAWRIFVASWKHVWRNLWIGLATVIVFTVGLLSVNILLATNVLLEKAVASIEDRIDVTVLFEPGTPEPLLAQAKSYMMNFPQVAHVRLVSADEALAELKERSKNNPKILEALSELASNPLGAQLIIKAKETKDYQFLLDTVRNPQYLPFIRKSWYDDHSQAIATIQASARSLRLFGSGLVAIFIFFGLLAAFNAIRVAIYTQREEIAIMRLVGASSAYIRLPYVLEGIWLAAFAGLITLASVWGLVLVAEPRLALFFGTDPGLSAFYAANWPMLIVLQFGTMAGLSGLVSWMAAGRYIRR
jgi:cell division protein FtsX